MGVGQGSQKEARQVVIQQYAWITHNDRLQLMVVLQLVDRNLQSVWRVFRNPRRGTRRSCAFARFSRYALKTVTLLSSGTSEGSP